MPKKACFFGGIHFVNRAKMATNTFTDSKDNPEACYLYVWLTIVGSSVGNSTLRVICIPVGRRRGL